MSKPNNTTSPLLKTLSSAGIGSRRWLADAIKQGKVAVNGQVVEGFNHPVDIETNRITINGQPVAIKPKRPVYLMLNKPKGTISTTNDEKGRRNVLDILPQKYRHLRLYPVGRLDKDSTGLLLLTNDGRLTYELTHPRFEHEKEYLVQVHTRLQTSEKQKLERGIKLEDGETHPAKIKERAPLPQFTYSLIIHEGKKRQIRRMFDSIGYQVTALKRIRLGNLNLGTLGEGKTRELSTQEIRSLLQQ
jgi:23S rRNA pseudouridine2605 synthase